MTILLIIGLPFLHDPYAMARSQATELASVDLEHSCVEAIAGRLNDVIEVEALANFDHAQPDMKVSQKGWKAESKPFRSPDTDLRKINIDISDGVVILTGETGNRPEREMAIVTALDTGLGDALNPTTLHEAAIVTAGATD